MPRLSHVPDRQIWRILPAHLARNCASDSTIGTGRVAVPFSIGPARSTVRGSGAGRHHERGPASDFAGRDGARRVRSSRPSAGRRSLGPIASCVGRGRARLFSTTFFFRGGVGRRVFSSRGRERRVNGASNGAFAASRRATTTTISPVYHSKRAFRRLRRSTTGTFLASRPGEEGGFEL